MTIDPRQPDARTELFCRAELTEKYTHEPVQPSIRNIDSDTYNALPPTEPIARSHYQSQQVDLLRAIVAQLMMRLTPPVTTIFLESFATECGPRASVKPAQVTDETPDKRYCISLAAEGSGS